MLVTSFVERISCLLKRYKTIVENFSYLSFLRIFTLLIPLLTYPYLIRVLGSDLYGRVVFAQSVIACFSMVINFGFNISATKDISISRDDKNEINNIMSSVLTIKLFLWILCLVFLFILMTFSESVRADSLLYIFSFGLCFNELLFPIWFFQGIEKMKYIAMVHFISKLFFLGIVFFVVREKEDYVLVAMLNGLGALFAGIIAMYLVFVKESVRYKMVSFERLKQCFVHSLPFFGSRITSFVGGKLGVIVLGYFVDMSHVAYYDLAQKLTDLLKIPFNLVNSSIYPYVAKKKDMLFMKKVIRYSLVFSLILYILLFVGAEYLVVLLAGIDMMPSVGVIRILSLTVISVSMSYHLGNCVLVVMGRAKDFNLSVVVSGLFYLLLLVLLVIYDSVSVYWVASVYVISEFFRAIYRYYYSVKYKII